MFKEFINVVKWIGNSLARIAVALEREHQEYHYTITTMPEYDEFSYEDDMTGVRNALYCPLCGWMMMTDIDGASYCTNPSCPGKTPDENVDIFQS